MVCFERRLTEDEERHQGRAARRKGRGLLGRLPGLARQYRVVDTQGRKSPAADPLFQALAKAGKREWRVSRPVGFIIAAAPSAAPLLGGLCMRAVSLHPTPHLRSLSFVEMHLVHGCWVSLSLSLSLSLLSQEGQGHMHNLSDWMLETGRIHYWISMQYSLLCSAFKVEFKVRHGRWSGSSLCWMSKYTTVGQDTAPAIL